MIIEAGYDLCTLLLEGRFDPGSLRMAVLDAELRLRSTRTVVPTFSGQFDDATLEAIELAIPDPFDDDDPGPRFVALGFEVADVSHFPESFDWEWHTALDEVLAGRGITSLGIQAYDEEKWASTGPMYAFESYALADDVPRVLVVPGPHPFLACECVVCGPRNERWRNAKASAPVEQDV